VIRLDPESPREERLTSEEAERKLFDAASPHLRGVLTAAHRYARDVLPSRGDPVAPMAGRGPGDARADDSRREGQDASSSTVADFQPLLAVLEMRRLDPSGKPFPSDAYVFGDRLGKRATSIRTAWEKRGKPQAGLTGFQLRDLRHEAASRFEEAGVLTTDVSKFLGHRNLSTTTRYLNTTSRRLRLALMRVEEAQRRGLRVLQILAKTLRRTRPTPSHTDDAEAPSMPSKSLVS